MSITGYSKPIVFGSDDLIILSARDRYRRESNLPSGWTRIRVGSFLSFCATTGANDDPLTENILAGAGERFNFIYGLGNGVGIPGDAGNKYVGFMSNVAASPVRMAYASAQWCLSRDTSGNSVRLHGAHGNGATIVRSSASYIAGARLFGSAPSGTSGFAFWIGAELDVTTAGTLVIRPWFSTVDNQSAATDTSIDAVVRRLVGETWTQTHSTTGGWWGAGTPVDCTHFYVRAPFSSNRLRIHSTVIVNL